MTNQLKVQKECQRQLLQVIDKNDQILVTCLNTAIEKHPTTTKRMTILLAATLKTRELKKAIVVLGASGLHDEMLVLLRTMMELIVNTCYLQDSSEEEVDRYLHFDAIAHHSVLQDFMESTRGSLGRPSMAKSIKTRAKTASDASGVKIGSRKWAVEHKTLKDRASFADQTLGSNLFSPFLATVYGFGNICTHASYQTLSKHAAYLETGIKEHPLQTDFAVTNALLGLSYAQGVLNRYFGRRFNLSMNAMLENSSEVNRLSEISRKDFGLYRREEQQNPICNLDQLEHG